jgi:hypothetical protein
MSEETPKKETGPDNRVAQMLQGRLNPPNEAVGYLVDRLRESIGESQATLQRISKTKETLARLERSATQLDGFVYRYEKDIVHLLNAEEAKEGKGE